MKRRSKIIFTITLATFISFISYILYTDTMRFDTTDGAYKYPYKDYSGKPFDFENFKLTKNGLRDTRGIIMEFEINCTTGQIIGFFGPVPIPIKKISERAIIVHKSQLACLQRGFTPNWEY